jgi:hypothetical protein
MGAVPQTSPPDTSYLASLVRNISGLDCCNCPISFLFWWWPTAKALFFPTWACEKHLQECLSPRTQKTSTGDPSPWHTEVEGPTFIKQNVQERLETLTNKRVEMKLWENKDKKGSLFLPMSPDYLLKSPSNI